jgi:hypothetical protein
MHPLKKPYQFIKPFLRVANPAYNFIRLRFAVPFQYGVAEVHGGEG